MADSPRPAPEPAADDSAPRGLAWFLDRTPPDGTPPPRTAGEWNRQAVAAFIARRSPKETPMPDPKPAPEHPQDTHDELLLIALSAQTGKTLTSLYDLIEVDLDDHEAMERVLAAVLPEHEQRVRAQAAAGHVLITADDLAELLDYIVGGDDVRVVRNETLDRAFAALKATLEAAIARGEAP